MSDRVTVDLPGVTPGTNPERFRAKAAAYLRQHEDHIALQRLRRNRQLTSEDLTALEEMLVSSGTANRADVVWVAEHTGGLGIFIRSLVGLDRHAAVDAFSDYLDGSRFTVEQIRFVQLIVDELTANGVMEPSRLFDSPYTDQAPAGADLMFGEDGLDALVEILQSVRQHAMPAADVS